VHYILAGVANYKFGNLDKALQPFKIFIDKTIENKETEYTPSPTVLRIMKSVFKGKQEHQAYYDWVIIQESGNQ